MKYFFKDKRKSALLLGAVLVILLIMTFSLAKSRDTLNRDLLVNEVASVNTSLRLGQDEGFYDYIEIKNASDHEMDLTGYYISDDENEPKKFLLPDKLLAPGELMLIYATGEDSPSDGEIHANFRLNQQGEEIVVFDGDKICAKIHLPKLEDGFSYGLNKEGDYVFFARRTPGEENSSEFYSSLKKLHNDRQSKSPIVISELSSQKQTSIYDEDGDFSDFIELHNTSSREVSIEGYFLSDEEDRPLMYRLPKITVKADGYCVIFASGKNRTKGGYVHTNFKLSPHDTLYLHDSKGALVEKIQVPALYENMSYGRSENGEFLFYSSPTPGFENDTEGKKTLKESKDTKGANVFISEVMSANLSSISDGFSKKSDWIELYNRTDKTVSLSGYYLSDTLNQPKKWAFPEGSSIQPGEYKIIFASGYNRKDGENNLHTNFRLNKNNQTVVLSRGDVIMDFLSYGKLKGNTSVGIVSEKNAQRCFFEKPTPREANTTTAFSGISAPVFASRPSGNYDKEFSVSLYTLQNNVKIYYTLDGSTPNRNSNIYIKPIKIRENTPLRAVSYVKGKTFSEVMTRNYLIKDGHGNLPVVFLTTDENNLFNGGIYSSGLGDERRKPANIELIEPDGKSGFNENVLISKHGNMSALEPQKSFGVYFKEGVGNSELNYNLFPEEKNGITTYRSFILRTSGNDWDDLKCKDGMLSMLAATEMDVDVMSYRPAVLYINGRYWGIYNIRDKQNGDYLETHHPGVDGNNVDIISFGHGIHQGDYKEYNKLLNFVRSKDLDKEENWQKLEKMMDIDNMIDTYLCHICYSNFDTVNIKWWRERKPDGKWRWFLYDLDYALYVPKQNNLAILTNPEGHGVGNYFDSTLMYRLMQSKRFQDRFLERLSKYWMTTFNSNNILAEFDKRFSLIEAEMPRQMKRWDIPKSHFYAEYNEMDDFLRRRPALMRKMVQNYFKLSDAELDKLLPSYKVDHPRYKFTKM